MLCGSGTVTEIKDGLVVSLDEPSCCRIVRICGSYSLMLMSARPATSRDGSRFRVGKLRVRMFGRIL